MDDTRSNHQETRFAQRILASILLSVGLIVLGVLIPPRLKLFGIYPLAMGGVIGIGIHKFLGSKHRRKWLVVIPALLIPVVVWNGQHIWLKHKYASAFRKTFDADPTRAWGINQSPPPGTEATKQYRQSNDDFQKELDRIERVRTEKTSFQGYLSARIAPLSVRSKSLAWGVYAGETLLAVIGSFLGVQFARRSNGLGKDFS